METQGLRVYEPLLTIAEGRLALTRIVTSSTAVALTLLCILGALMVDAFAGPLERVEFESASQRLIPGGLIRGDRIHGYLAKPDGTGPFPAVVGLHGCAGMHDTTKQRLANELIAGGYVVLLVDSYATRDIDHACTSTAFATFLRRRPDAYGALVFLAQPTLRRRTTCGCGRLLGWRSGFPLGGRAQGVRTVRPSRQLALPGGGCVLSAM